MKHPVDTSQWGEFVVGELFELTGIKQVKSQHHVVEDPNGIPFVVQSNKNNMVKMKADKQWLLDNDEPVVEGNAIVLGVTLPVVSYQPYEFGASQVITARSEYLNELRGLFIASVINSFVIPKYSYVYKPGIQKYKQDTIPLPLKPSADPSNYDQTDIDWTYMETVMSRVTTRAKERLASLPQPTDKKKTPVDTSTWGEFNVTTLFDVINTKSIRQSDIREQLQSNDGSIPYITASDKNNAIAAYIECPQEWIDKGNCIFIGGKTTTITYQPQDFCSNDSHNLALYLKNEQARTKYIQLYLASILKKAFAKYHWGDALSKAKIKAESIKLPLKSAADPSNYTQEDIDWDYMDRFMQVIEEKAHERLVELNSYMNEDD